MSAHSQTARAALLEVRALRVFYDRVEVLKGISLHIDAGEIVTIIGANGAGKSTLMNSILGNPQARSGRILYRGKEITRLPTHAISRQGIALVPEGRRVFSRLTIEENLRIGGFLRDGPTIARDLERVYALFPHLKTRRKQRAGTLSGGEQQMLAIGRGLMMAPELLLLDEPSLGLAPLVIAQIFEVISDIRAQGITVLLVEQNAHKALQIADRGYVLEVGTITLEGSGANLLACQKIKAAYLGA